MNALEIEGFIRVMDEEIVKKIAVEDVPSDIVEKLISLLIEKKRIEDSCRYYKQNIELKVSVDFLGERLRDVKSSAISDISEVVNNRMTEMHRCIYPDERKPPLLSLTLTSYRFDTLDDTGTGTAFSNLIAFDLSLLDLTQLPALVHDLPLLKNIENFAFSNIVRLYLGFKKQIFIAIDKLNSYDSEIEQILRKLAVLELSKDKTLFGMDWKTVR